MYAGRIVEMAPTRTLFQNMRMPYTQALFESIPKLDLPSHHRLTVIPGRPPDLVNPPTGCSFAPRCERAQTKCLGEQPPLMEAETPDHRYACFFPVGTPAGDEALAQNHRRGHHAAGVPVAIHEKASSLLVPAPHTSPPTPQRQSGGEG